MLLFDGWAQHEQNMKQREELVKKMEQEELAKLRGSPEILERSRRLAEKKVCVCVFVYTFPFFVHMHVGKTGYALGCARGNKYCARMCICLFVYVLVLFA